MATGIGTALTGNLLAGYDMVVAISQNEINSQFQRLLGVVIKPEITANGLSAAAFGGTHLKLGSYIRGFINAPQVMLATVADPYQVLFNFTFQSHPVTAQSLGVAAADLQASFAKSADGVNGLLSKPEDIPWFDSKGQPQTLVAQPVFYWLRRTQTKVGTITVNAYSLVPSLLYNDSGTNVMVSLEGLQLSFQVRLDKIPTTAAAIQAAVKAGTVPQQLLQTIQNNHFDTSAFSLEQLFLNFDTVDFTQWNLKDPAQALGGKVTGLAINSDGTFDVSSTDLKTLLGQEPDFSTQLSTNLQYVFGGSDKNTAGANGYIVGVSVTSTSPGGAHPTLVPTFIGYSTVPNTADRGLSAINYQVLGGPNPDSRVPRTNAGSVVNVTTNFIANNDFSGEILFARSAMFDPVVMGPIQQALNTQAVWTQSGNTWSSHFTGTSTLQTVDQRDSVTKTGGVATVTEDQDNTYQIQVTWDRIVVSGSFSMTRTVGVQEYVFSGPAGFYSWQKNASLNWSVTITMSISATQELVFGTTQDIPDPTIGDTVTNEGASIVQSVLDFAQSLTQTHLDTIGDAMTTLGNGSAEQLKSRAAALSQGLTSSLRNNFISPTGQLFFLNAPRFNQNLDLQMDITYEV